MRVKPPQREQQTERVCESNVLQDSPRLFGRRVNIGRGGSGGAEKGVYRDIYRHRVVWRRDTSGPIDCHAKKFNKEETRIHGVYNSLVYSTVAFSCFIRLRRLSVQLGKFTKRKVSDGNVFYSQTDRTIRAKTAGTVNATEIGKKLGGEDETKKSSLYLRWKQPGHRCNKPEVESEEHLPDVPKTKGARPFSAHDASILAFDVSQQHTTATQRVKGTRKQRVRDHTRSGVPANGVILGVH